MSCRNVLILLLYLIIPLNSWSFEVDKWKLIGDTLNLYSGSTYAYTVDTPEGEGLVSTLATVQELTDAFSTSDTICRILDKAGKSRVEGNPEFGDVMELRAVSGKKKKLYAIKITKAALPPILKLKRGEITVGVQQDITLYFYAGQRSSMVEVEMRIPTCIDLTLDNTTINVIGRGDVILRNLPNQSIGRTGTNYSYNRVGKVELIEEREFTVLRLKELDFRPSNGPDIQLTIKGGTVFNKGEYPIEVLYRTSQPEELESPKSVSVLKAVSCISDFERIPVRRATYVSAQDYTWTSFDWTPPVDADQVTLLASVDKGKNWKEMPVDIAKEEGHAAVYNLLAQQLYAFKLHVKGGANEGDSNIAWYYSGTLNVQEYGVIGNGVKDETASINELIDYANQIGGGTLFFPAGVYNIRTIHLKSNVWLYVDKDATIAAMLGADAPETTWFSDRAYRFGLSPTDSRPYQDPENYLTKQDVGHTFFRNSMFFGECIENVKIIGTGRITGNGNIVTTDRVMNNELEKRCDKMFSFKLCRNIEIGGLENGLDMWYASSKDMPYYIDGEEKKYDDGNMLHIDQGGHFVLLATGTDQIYVHDTYFGKFNTKNARDIYDFMACNDVRVLNIYSKVSSDDIVKIGSDCSLGFTRHASDFWARNIIGDTNCNLCQIGSETADDIQELYIDNIYVLGANKAGFSISANDGGHIKNVFLNSGKTGPLHSRSVMRRTRTPFFISISNRGRVLGADVEMFIFTEEGKERKELLVTNSNIGKVENVYINGLDITEVYGGSSFKGDRWKPYDGTQNESTPIIAGFKLPTMGNIKKGRDFCLPDGRHTGYIKNIHFNDVNLTVKGGHPLEDANSCPPEIGVGRYNVGDLKVQPSFGFWLRHVDGFVLNQCSIKAEKADGRYPIYMEDVFNAKIINVDVSNDDMINKELIKYVNCDNVIPQK